MSDDAGAVDPSALAARQRRYDFALTVVATVVAIAVCGLAIRVTDPRIGPGRIVAMLSIVAGVAAVHLLYADTPARGLTGREGSRRAMPRPISRPEALDPALDWRLGYVVIRLLLLTPMALSIDDALAHPDVRRADLVRFDGIPVRTKVVVPISGRNWPAPIVVLRLAEPGALPDSLHVTLAEGLGVPDCEHLIGRIRIGVPATVWTLRPHVFMARAGAFAYEFVQGTDTLVRFDESVWYDRHVRVGYSGMFYFYAALVGGGLLLAGVNRASLRHPLFARWNRPDLGPPPHDSAPPG